MCGMHSTVERAFELARSGTFANVYEISRQLKREGYDRVAAHLSGSEIKRQLLAVIKASSAGGAD